MVMACRAHKHAHAAVVLQTGMACDLIESHHPTTTCTVSTIAHISPSTDSLEPDCSLMHSRPQSLIYRRLWIPDCSFHSPLCRFERNRSSSRRLQIVSSPTARSHPRCFECNHSSITDYGLSQAWLLVPVLAVLSTTAHLAVYGFSRARPLIPVLTVSSAITRLSPSMDCLKPDRSLCTVSSATGRILLAMDCLESDCSFPSPLCHFECNCLFSRRLRIVSSLTARSRPCCFECNHSSITEYRLSQAWLLVPVLAISSATTRLAVYGLSRD
ncbi:hypothetical protein EV363DRAFT_1165212 [Boletus edulis]|nr:hypothetical protein EV363DRAFT_1165212 [Boletus edulis]